MQVKESTKTSYQLGFDLGGTKCAVVLAKLEPGQLLPQIIGRQAFLTAETKEPGPTIQRLLDLAGQLLDQAGNVKPAAAGISCGGPLDAPKGLILSPPNLPGWDNIPIASQISQALDIPAYLMNDADAGALAEWRFGAGRGQENLVFITFGTGFGAGLILNGRLYSGTNSGAGEIGHIRISDQGPVGFGKAGSLEGFCSGGGIAQLARQMVLEKTQLGEQVAWVKQAGGSANITARLVGQAAAAGDELARQILAVSGHYLGRALAILLDLLNPQVIIIGSIFVRCRQWLWPEAEKVLRRESLARNFATCQVLPAQLDEQIGDLAAISIALAAGRGRF